MNIYSKTHVKLGSKMITTHKRVDDTTSSYTDNIVRTICRHNTKEPQCSSVSILLNRCPSAGPKFVVVVVELDFPLIIRICNISRYYQYH